MSFYLLDMYHKVRYNNTVMNKKRTSFTLSPEALQLLKELSTRLGISQASTLEILIREKSESFAMKGKNDARHDNRMD